MSFKICEADKQKVEAFLLANKLSDIKVNSIDRLKVGNGGSSYFKNTRMFLNTEAIAYNRGKKRVLERDLQLWYSALSIVLFKKYKWNQDEVLDAINLVLEEAKRLMSISEEPDEWLKEVARKTKICFFTEEDKYQEMLAELKEDEDE